MPQLIPQEYVVVADGNQIQVGVQPFRTVSDVNKPSLHSADADFSPLFLRCPMDILSSTSMKVL